MTPGMTYFHIIIWPDRGLQRRLKHWSRASRERTECERYDRGMKSLEKWGIIDTQGPYSPHGKLYVNRSREKYNVVANSSKNYSFIRSSYLSLLSTPGM